LRSILIDAIFIFQVEMVGRVAADIFLQNKAIVPGVAVSITFEQSDDAFRLLSGTDVHNEKFKITQAVLKVRRITLAPTSLLYLEKQLTTKPAVYPLYHAVCRTAQIALGQMQLSNYVVHSGQVPRLCMIAMTPTGGFQGDYGANPYSFTLRNARSAQLECNGVLYPNTHPYSPKKSWIDPYLNSLRVINKLFSKRENNTFGSTLSSYFSFKAIHPLI
jgi:hypothetical protein